MMKAFLSFSALSLIAFTAFYFLCGLFVIQPIGAIPEGATIVYFRYETNLPFIASADGMLDQTGTGVSLLGRGLALGVIAKGLEDKKICRLPYSKTLYLISTEGKEYGN
jgi:hypothetical protein